jgi:hypothetical protein
MSAGEAGLELACALAQEQVDGPAVERRAQLGDARVHVGRRGAQLGEDVLDDLVGAVRARVERAEHEVRGVDALLGRVVQLPGDPLALGLHRQALGLGALLAQRNSSSDA